MYFCFWIWKLEKHGRIIWKPKKKGMKVNTLMTEFVIKSLIPFDVNQNSTGIGKGTTKFSMWVSTEEDIKEYGKNQLLAADAMMG